MAREKPQIGQRLLARGPHRVEGEPDVDGVITEIVDDQRVRVQEEKYDTPTTIKIDGGWFLLTIAGIVIVGVGSGF